MDKLIFVVIGITCSLTAKSYASLESYPEIARYIDITIEEISKRYENEIDELHRKLEENKRKFENEIAAIKRQADTAAQMYSKDFSDLRSDISHLEDKVCPAEPNRTKNPGSLDSAGRTPAMDTVGNPANAEADKETQTQNEKRDLEKIEGSTNYYREHAVPIPEFLPVQTNVVVGEGEMAKLRCRIENLGTKMVSWRKTTEISPLTTGEDTFSPDYRIEVAHEEISETESEWDLIINDVRKHHAGIYECQISATETYTTNVSLTVLDNTGYGEPVFDSGSNVGFSDPKKQKPVISIKGTEYVSLKSSVRLLCNVTGEVEAPSSVDWFFEGDPIDQVKPKWYGRLTVLNRIKIPGRSFISEIILEQATMLDRGNYVCRSGKLAKSFKVHILNDKRPSYSDPKREIADSGEMGSKFSMSGASRVLQRHVTMLTTLCYIVFGLLSLS